MTNVERFSADCLHHATNWESIASMPRLKSLGIGIFHLETFDFLSLVNPNLTELYLSATKSSKPSLKMLERFRGLKLLYLEGQQKNIDVIASLSELEELTMRSITLKSLSIVRALPKLWSLDLKLGGTKDLAELQGLDNLKYLELWKILGLDDISVIESLYGLQSLFLQDLPRVTRLPSFLRLHKLRRVTIENLKNLVDLSPLNEAPALEEIVHTFSKVPLDSYLPLLRSGQIKSAHAGFGSFKKNAEFKRVCEANGVVCGVNGEFIFR
jgi:hypothetical protein